MDSRRYPFLVMLLSFALVLAACGGSDGGDDDMEATGAETGTEDGAQAGAELEGGETISLMDGQYQSIQILNEIAKYVLENGFDHTVSIEVLGAAAWEQAMLQGDLDVVLELWRVNRPEWYQKAVEEEGAVVDLGQTYDRATQGFYVPTYVIEGDQERGIEPMAPDLKAVEQLDEYTDVFADPEDPSKGLFINCLAQWTCAEISQIKLGAFDLLDDYNTTEPGAGAALDAAIVGAYEKGEPVLTYYWEPTALMGRLELTKLEMPEWTEECDEATTQTQEEFGDTGDFNQAPEAAACDFRTHTINKGVAVDLEDRAPQAYAFLERFSMTTEVLNQTAATMDEQEMELPDVALWFFENHEDVWREWVDGELEASLEQTLADDGVELGGQT